jgi:hypothetical protein
MAAHAVSQSCVQLHIHAHARSHLDVKQNRRLGNQHVAGSSLGSLLVVVLGNTLGLDALSLLVNLVVVTEEINVCLSKGWQRNRAWTTPAAAPSSSAFSSLAGAAGAATGAAAAAGAATAPAVDGF